MNTAPFRQRTRCGGAAREVEETLQIEFNFQCPT